jgi:hypothetical protein
MDKKKPEAQPGCRIWHEPMLGRWVEEDAWGRCRFVDDDAEYHPTALEFRIESLLKEGDLSRLTDDQVALVRRALPLALKYLRDGGVP